MQAVALLILGAVLTVASLAIGYFPTDRATWRKVVLGLGLAGAALSFILGYKNLERALDLQKEVEHLKPWHVSDEQAKNLRAGLSSLSPGKIAFDYRLMDAEGEGFAKQLAEIFKSAGWSCYCASPRASRSRAFPSARYKRSGLTTDLIVNHTIKSGAVLVRLNNPDTGPNGADANAQCQPSGLLLADKQASVADIDELSKDGGLRSDRADSEVPLPGPRLPGGSTLERSV